MTEEKPPCPKCGSETESIDSIYTNTEYHGEYNEIGESETVGFFQCPHCRWLVIRQ